MKLSTVLKFSKREVTYLVSALEALVVANDKVCDSEVKMQMRLDPEKTDEAQLYLSKCADKKKGEIAEPVKALLHVIDVLEAPIEIKKFEKNNVKFSVSAAKSLEVDGGIELWIHADFHSSYMSAYLLMCEVIWDMYGMAVEFITEKAPIEKFGVITKLIEEAIKE